MRSINLKKFHQNLWTEIKDLPVAVTRYDSVIFKIMPPEKTRLDNTIKEDKTSLPEPEEICSADGCFSVADAVGRIWDEMEQDFVDVPMCKKHALKSLKEII